jgi:hypothetical protein
VHLLAEAPRSITPQIISLNDLSVSAAGQASESAVALHGDKPVWSGALADDKPASRGNHPHSSAARRLK